MTSRTRQHRYQCRSYCIWFPARGPLDLEIPKSNMSFILKNPVNSQSYTTTLHPLPIDSFVSGGMSRDYHRLCRTRWSEKLRPILLNTWVRKTTYMSTLLSSRLLGHYIAFFLNVILNLVGAISIHVHT